MASLRPILTGFLLFFLTVVSSNSLDDLEAQEAVVRANNAFGINLYQTFMNETGNLVISPLSVSTVMAMAWTGAAGETASELARGLHLPNNRAQVEKGFKKLLPSLRSSYTVTLDMGNKMYIRKGFHLKDSFRNSAVNNFQSDAEEADFFNSTEVVRTAVNQWVEEKTHNKIKDLIQKGTLNKSALLLLVNAIYFKGGWLKPFDESDTTTEIFHLTPTSNVNVSMMHVKDYYFYGDVQGLNSKVLRLVYRPYDHNRWMLVPTMSMILILPNEIDGLANLEASISNLNVTKLKEALSYDETIIDLPRFKVETTSSLKEKLKQLGITKVFGPEADFSGIADVGLYIDSVVQKAFVEVTEKGTEAAAATVAEAIPSALQETIPEFRANHPFMFLIVDDSTDMILFMGRVANPK